MSNAFFLPAMGGLPVPTVTGLTMVLMQLSSIAELRVALIGVGDRDAIVLTLPAVAVFFIVLVVLCTKFRHTNPRLPVWDE